MNASIIAKMLWHIRSLSYILIKLKTIWAIRKKIWPHLTFDFEEVVILPW